MRKSIHITFVFIALIGFSTTSQASSTEHATLCSYCQSAYQFGVHGVAALETKQGSKSLLGRISVSPITVHNPTTRKAARVTVNLATSSVSIGLVTIGVPDLSRVGFSSEFTDGSGSRESSVSVALIEKIIKEREIKLNGIVDCPRSECQDLDEVLNQKADKERAEQKHLSYLLHGGAIDNALLAAEAYASSMGPVFQQYNKYRWESTYRAASLGGFSIGSPVNTAIPTITQHWYDPGSPSEVIDIDVWESY